MEMLKVLTLLIVVTMTLNNGCTSNTVNKAQQLSCEDSVIFYFEGKEICLMENDFNMNVQENNCELTILNEDKLVLIRTGKLPVISFCIDEKKYQAKGNTILSSEVPKDCDYFFSIDDDGRISFFKKNVISFIKIKQ